MFLFCLPEENHKRELKKNFMGLKTEKGDKRIKTRGQSDDFNQDQLHTNYQLVHTQY